MSKHLKPDEWIYLFDKYKNRKSNILFWLEYSEKTNKKITKDVKRWFIQKYIQYNLGNMEVIYSKTGRSPKKGNNAAKSKKRKINWEEFTKDEMIKIIEWYIERDEKDEKKKQNIKDSQSLQISSRKKQKFLVFLDLLILKIKN